MEVRLAEHYGMCFGVRDAVDLALRVTRQGPLTILGDLVHNPDVVAQMDAAGAQRAHYPDEVQTRAVMLTAHGTADRVKRELRSQGLQVHDATCPLVKRVHLALDRLVAEGRHPVVVGQAGHVEVRGLVGDFAEYTIILNEEDIEQLASRPRLGIVAQTTQPLDHVLHLVEAIRRRFPDSDIRFIDTVCQPTKDRQEALRRLATECDAIVVVGGPDSNNSRKLTELARKLGRPAYQVASAAELRPEWFENIDIVGVTAGTSTPERIVNEVCTWLESLNGERKGTVPVSLGVGSRLR
ncbi:MAG TPA: 4-hydroxy-3-methylbut-2-enyl diphosphate reductase [Gemmataceae bacterium]|nr:4-hydroxy-3-methylbut-2-enyl diphosphate reductase [Gemmataceae bacterium]